MGPKKTPRNAFYFYMMEIKPEFDRQKRGGGMEALVQYAHPRWKDLPAKEKTRFEGKAKEFKRLGTTNSWQMGRAEKKLDNQGQAVSSRINPETVERKLSKLVESFASSWPVGDAFLDQQFFVIDFQHLAKSDTGVYLPVEMAMTSFTLRSGVVASLHSFVKPPAMGYGERYPCMRKSEETHKIPVEGHPSVQSEEAYGGIWIKMENFINPEQSTRAGSWPPVFCRSADMEMVQYCVDFLHTHKLYQGANHFRVLELEKLLINMSKKSPNMAEGKHISLAAALTVLDSTEFDYNMDIRCSFHREKEVKFCSLGLTKGICYSILKNMYRMFTFETTLMHFPPVDRLSQQAPRATITHGFGGAPSNVKANTPSRAVGMGRGLTVFQDGGGASRPGSSLRQSSSQASSPGAGYSGQQQDDGWQAAPQKERKLLGLGRGRGSSGLVSQTQPSWGASASRGFPTAAQGPSSLGSPDRSQTQWSSPSASQTQWGSPGPSIASGQTVATNVLPAGAGTAGNASFSNAPSTKAMVVPDVLTGGDNGFGVYVIPNDQIRPLENINMEAILARDATDRSLPFSLVGRSANHPAAAVGLARYRQARWTPVGGAIFAGAF